MSAPRILSLDAGTSIHIYPDSASLSRAAAESFVHIARSSLQARGLCNVALAGGSTPRSVYQLLAGSYATALPWEKVNLFFGDERSVGPEDPQSNYRMVRETLLANPAIKAVTHRIEFERPAAAAAAHYEEVLRKYIPTPASAHPRFDVILLGMGTDGHTASLFPNTAALGETERSVVANVVPQLQTERITLTFPVLNAGRHVLFLAAGGEKSGVLAKVLQGTERTAVFPSQRVKPTDGTTVWMVDAAAAKDLLLK